MIESTTARRGNVLISGASLAGPALAFWLHRFGFTATVVERAPRLREGGQAVDFRGAAHLQMLTRMGLLDEIRELRTPEGRLNVIDADGRTLASLPPEFTGGDVEIQRGDLAQLLFDKTEAYTEYVFGDSITGLTDTEEGVHVTFERGAPRTFDLVIGADGLHSNVRKLTFGDESRFLTQSGYYVAIFNAPNSIGLGDDSVLYNEPGVGVMAYGTRGGDQCEVMCLFESAPIDYDHRDIDQQKRILADVMADVGWQTQTLMRELESATSFYFDTISVVEMDRYSQGRIALIGDAGYGATCGGMGAGMSLISAYVLAAELAAADGDHRVAFARYEEQIRGYATACQKVAKGAGPTLAPPTAKKLSQRNRMFKVLTFGPLSRLLAWMSTRAANAIDVGRYESVLERVPATS
ncbi:FAD-dependent monooxygenase [Rhodococcus oryzae]|uniref:FAD-dependent monooxygenase n=1 Tax=Rhodococcus oryzae TaxID=2571143 RepID=UPI0037160216